MVPGAGGQQLQGKGRGGAQALFALQGQLGGLAALAGVNIGAGDSVEAVPLKALALTLIIFAGVVLVNVEQATATSVREVLWGALPVLVAAFAYPIGNQSAKANLERAKLQMKQTDLDLKNQELAIVTQVTDAGLEHLKPLKRLREVILWNTRVTPRKEMEKAFREAGFRVLTEGPYQQFDHRVDQAIQRDILVALRPVQRGTPQH